VSESTPAPRSSHAVCQLTGQWRDRQYLLHGHGPDAPVSQPPPLVVRLHGRGIDATRFDWWTGFSGLADEAGFLLAIPEAVGERWNDGRQIGPTQEIDDVGFLAAVIEDVGARLPVDRTRVYLVGMSNGAAMAGRFACAAGCNGPSDHAGQPCSALGESESTLKRQRLVTRCRRA